MPATAATRRRSTTRAEAGVGRRFWREKSWSRVTAMPDLGAVIAAYNDAWNRQDLDAICSAHAPGMVFENHTAGERAEGDAVREHLASIFSNWPDLRFAERSLYV